MFANRKYQGAMAREHHGQSTAVLQERATPASRVARVDARGPWRMAGVSQRRGGRHVGTVVVVVNI